MAGCMVAICVSNRLEAAGQVFGDDARMKGGQDFGAGKIGQITGPARRAGFFQAAIFVLGDAKDDNAVAGFSRHKNQAVRYKRALSACVAPWTATQDVAIDLDGDGAAEQLDADDDAQGIFFAEEDALETGERAALDADGLADADERPGLGRQAGSQDGLDIVDFGLRDGNGVAAEANDGGDAGGDEHGQAAVVIEAAEHKSGEQAAPRGIERHILFSPRLRSDRATASSCRGSTLRANHSSRGAMRGSDQRFNAAVQTRHWNFLAAAKPSSTATPRCSAPANRTGSR